MLDKLTEFTTKWTGSTVGFLTAVCTILVWLALGPAEGFSDTWQLYINTLTTLVTFLMVFLLQRSQNKELLAIHIKLNELIRSIAQANNSLVKVEQKSEAEVLRIYNNVGDINMSKEVQPQAIASEVKTTEGAASAERAAHEQTTAKDNNEEFNKLLQKAKDEEDEHKRK